MYKFDFGFGDSGTQEEKLRQPFAVDVDSEGYIYVADTGNSKIKVYKPNGDYLTFIGESGEEEYEFKEPRGVAVLSDDNNVYVYVADSANNRIQKWLFDRETNMSNHLVNFAGPFPGIDEFHRPSGIDVDSSGNIYVSDTGNNRIVVLKPNGDYWTHFEGYEDEDNFREPYGVAVLSDGSDAYVYVADSANNRIQKWRFNKISEECVHLINYTGPSATNGFHNPRRVDVDGFGIYVADTSNDRVVVLYPDGSYNEQFNGSGEEYGQFSSPYGIAVKSVWGKYLPHSIYVAEFGNNRIQKFIENLIIVSKTMQRLWELKLNVDNTETLIAMLDSENATKKSMSWTSSNEAVATVNSGGTVTAKEIGFAVVTATTEDGEHKASCMITVTGSNNSKSDVKK